MCLCDKRKKTDSEQRWNVPMPLLQDGIGQCVHSAVPGNKKEENAGQEGASVDTACILLIFDGGREGEEKDSEYISFSWCCSSYEMKTPQTQ